MRPPSFGTSSSYSSSSSSDEYSVESIKKRHNAILEKMKNVSATTQHPQQSSSTPKLYLNDPRHTTDINPVKLHSKYMNARVRRRISLGSSMKTASTEMSELSAAMSSGDEVNVTLIDDLINESTVLDT